MVDSFTRWRIADAKTFYETVRTEYQAKERLNIIINSNLRQKLAQHDLVEVVSGDRKSIMNDILNAARFEANKLGVEIVDVRIKRIDYPEKISESVYQRMRTERERDAREFRSKGREAAERVTADADKQSKVILAEAYRDAEKLRGDGDAKAASIYSSSFSRDREFYRFYRSLEAYKETFNNKSDVMLIQPDSEFFRYLKDSKGKIKK